jgi:hypothetical protein
MTSLAVLAAALTTAVASARPIDYRSPDAQSAAAAVTYQDLRSPDSADPQPVGATPAPDATTSSDSGIDGGQVAGLVVLALLLVAGGATLLVARRRGAVRRSHTPSVTG